MGNDAISFDSLFVYQEDTQFPKEKGFFAKIWEAIKRFFASFTDQSYSVDNVDKKHLQVWVNRSRQYLEILQQTDNREREIIYRLLKEYAKAKKAMTKE